MTDSIGGAPRLTEPDSRVLDVTWSSGVVHLYLNRTEVLSLSPAAAEWLGRNASICARSAADPTAFQ
ncbi:hypothetical protein AWC17_03190 [Mycobacterium nebraskense]|uniref:Uncharacterized protein n=1 Tax=Mycobacterium nebraskense TaxID=244292 RepID=A0A1X1ZN99_9MYCO|nr:hypothetical protein AWC17_03190 [Mycobacterium nebraskense]